MEALAELFEYGKAFLTTQTTSMQRPDDDWQSYAIGSTGLKNEAGAYALCSVELDVPDEQRDEVYTRTIPAMVRDTAAKIVLVLAKGSTQVEGEAAPREVLMVTATDGATTRFAFAPINRSTDKPPTLGLWHEEPAHTIDGAILEPIRRALER